MTYDIPECVRLLRADAIRQRVQAIQASMKESADGCFSESELEHLGVVIRLAVELHEYFQLSCTHSFCLEYVSESIFSGI
ncbi:MAG: hypothetical protein WBD23_09015, partial [Candidatus Acidiferrales bacterium]